jgi:hypothetical protein
MYIAWGVSSWLVLFESLGLFAVYSPAFRACKYLCSSTLAKLMYSSGTRRFARWSDPPFSASQRICFPSGVVREFAQSRVVRCIASSPEYFSPLVRSMFSDAGMKREALHLCDNIVMGFEHGCHFLLCHGCNCLLWNKNC